MGASVKQVFSRGNRVEGNCTAEEWCHVNESTLTAVLPIVLHGASSLEVTLALPISDVKL